MESSGRPVLVLANGGEKVEDRCWCRLTGGRPVLVLANGGETVEDRYWSRLTEGRQWKTGVGAG